MPLRYQHIKKLIIHFSYNNLINITHRKKFSLSAANMVLAKKFTIAKIFDGPVKESDFALEEEELPSPQDDEFIAEARFLSVDPYMRAYYRNYKLGQVMIGGQIAQVIESKNKKFPVGMLMSASFGWRTHTLVTKKSTYDINPLPDFGELSPSLGLGMLGMPGVTSLYGFLEICKPKEGETVVVTGAAGAVGSHVGQIGLIKGCQVVGLAGSADKCRWLREELGFHHAINYKDKDWEAQLEKATPKGIDCYFDNVGGEMSSIIIQRMNSFGRISVCGSISSYDDDVLPKATILQPAMVMKQLTMRGFIATAFADRWQAGILQNLQWINEKKLKYRETYTHGFRNMPQALIELLEGRNIGKAVVTASNVDTQSLNYKATRDTFNKK